MAQISSCRKSPLKSSNGGGEASAVTVEDSPVKVTSKSKKRRIESDSEDDEITTVTKTQSVCA